MLLNASFSPELLFSEPGLRHFPVELKLILHTSFFISLWVDTLMLNLNFYAIMSQYRQLCVLYQL